MPCQRSDRLAAEHVVVSLVEVEVAVAVAVAEPVGVRYRRQHPASALVGVTPRIYASIHTESLLPAGKPVESTCCDS